VVDTIQYRLAQFNDVAALKALIAASIRALGLNDYTVAQIEGALLGAFGVDTQLIHDQTYFVATDSLGSIVGCGGYSFRRTLFGGDQAIERDAADLNPRSDAAKIRAFFVHPQYARRGIGRELLNLSEQGAKAMGFHRFEMMATLPGVRLYEVMGYQALSPIEYPLPNGESIRFVPMHKSVM
jgi:GNAT superfamily N-acetyltransferase